MAETKPTPKHEFWLFHDVEEQEIVELRKFIDIEIDFKSLEGISELFHKLNHIME